MKNETQGHTPGPLVADCYGAHTLDNYVEITVRAGDETPDCDCQLRYSHMIAAAPELLAAAKIGLLYMNNENEDMEKVRAAIAKAEDK